jgi:hypothetical protein
MPTPTTNYSFSIPTVGADDELWGGFLNANWTALDTLLFSGTIGASTTGNAATATTATTATSAIALATARTINGVSFDGTANITLPTVNTSGDQTVNGTKTFSAAIVLSTAGTTTTQAVRADRTLTAGAGLTGGGNLTADRTISVATNGIGTTQLATGEQMTTANVLGATAGASAGAVGTYAYLLTTSGSTTITAGTTYAGSSLRFGGVRLAYNFSVQAFSGLSYGTVQSGTWRAMATVDNNSGLSASGLFLRIS